MQTAKKGVQKPVSPTRSCTSVPREGGKPVHLQAYREREENRFICGIESKKWHITCHFFLPVFLLFCCRKWSEPVMDSLKTADHNDRLFIGRYLFGFGFLDRSLCSIASRDDFLPHLPTVVISCLHLGQYSGYFSKTVSSLILLRVLFLQTGQSSHSVFFIGYLSILFILLHQK